MSSPSSRAKARESIAKLVADFNKGRTIFKDPRKFDEAKVRAGFIDPFFEALGWAVREGQRRVGREREVVVEDRAGRGGRDRPDYGFYANRELKFYVEAKQPSRDLASDAAAPFQLKSYVWSKRAPLGLLTDFEELLAFHGAFKPRQEKPALGRVSRLCVRNEQYEDKFELLYDTLSREAVLGGSIEKLLAEELAATVRQRGQVERDLFKARGAVAVDSDFLESLTTWRADIAQEFARRNDFHDGSELTEAVQRFLDRLVFARVAEDRGIERTDTLAKAIERWERDGKKKPLYGYLIELFGRLTIQFNGGLFSPHALSDEAKFTNDAALASLVKSLYFPESAYRFDAMPVELLGSVYEQFLGSVVRITDGGHRAKVEEKPEVRHAGGVYYTPTYIVNEIVHRTLAPLLKDATSESALELRVLDPACGSGSFLLGAFQYLMDWHLRYYAKSANPPKSYPGACYVDEDGNLRLTLRRKRDILTKCLYGVDIDPQAVEVAQMSLYLKLMEDEAEETLAFQRSLELFKAERYLPNLSKNILCGNSLISTQDLDPQFEWSDEDERRINAFDWQATTTGFGSIVGAKAQGGRGGFDAIIGNPPYIRVQAMTEWAPVEVAIYKRLYRTAAEGNYDIYVVFVEKSLALLRPGGRLGFILPTKWWQAAYGQALRSLLRDGQHYAETIDFAHEQVFEDPTTYTCLSIFTKSPAPSIQYARLSPDDLRRSTGEAKPLWSHAVTWESVGNGPWYLGVPSQVRGLFERLRATGPFLGDKNICPRVFQGLKTSLDPVYVLDVAEDRGATLVVRSKALDEELVLESEPLKWIVKGAQMKRFAPLPARKVVLVPYAVENDEAALIPQKRFKEDYPRIWEYLSRNRRALEARERGRMKHAEWYAYIYPKNLTLFARPKLLTADLADRMNFSLDSEGAFHLLGGAAGGYGLLPAKQDFAAPLLALLNSRLLEWMLRPPGLSSPFRGGWFSCEARFINLLPIRFPSSKKDMEELGSLALRAVEAYRKRHSARSQRDIALATRQIETIESDIDDRVFRIYEVSPEERREIERLVEEARAVSSGEDAEPGEERAATA